MRFSRMWILVFVVVFVSGFSCGYSEDVPKPDPAFGEWITLFDGKSFDGWERSKPMGKDFNWTIEDGAMTNDVSNLLKKHNIATKRKFHNFESHVEFKISKGGNSGVYLRGRAEVQIFDSNGKTPLGDSDMGALYKFKAPEQDATLPAGEWNTLDIRFIGTHLNVVLNGKLVQNNAPIDHKTGHGREDAFDSPGIFELQGDHDKVWFRNVRIRPLFEAEGWQPLFNGQDFTGWKPYHGNEIQWIVENGEIANNKRCPDIITDKNYGDFLVHYEYRSNGNSGFYLRNLWELQVENNFGKETHKNADGALYDFYPPLVNMSKPRGEWSVMEVKLVGRKITAFQNGVMTHNERECPARTYNTGDSSNLDAPGPFLLQGDHGRVWFTNMWVKPLN